MRIYESAEDYLEAILVIGRRRGMVRSIDIANELGFSKPSVSVAMKKLRESGYIKSLRLVLLTHEHGDHFNKATVRALHKERPALRWVCCKWMVFPLLEAGVDKRAIILIKPGRWYQCGFPIQFRAETLIHDAENCGYHLKLDYETAFYATDTGTLDHIGAKDYDLYLIEANHTRAEIEERIADKLARGEFAYEVRAARNHLSREQALDWLARNAGPNSRVLFLHQHKDKEDK